MLGSEYLAVWLEELDQNILMVEVWQQGVFACRI